MQQLSCFCISIEHKKMAKEFTAMQRWNSQITHYKWLERKQEYINDLITAHFQINAPSGLLKLLY